MKENKYFIIGLSILFFFVVFFSSINYSMTYDELSFTARSYYFIKTLDFNLTTSHPPLMSLIGGTPFIFFETNNDLLSEMKDNINYKYTFNTFAGDKIDDFVFLWAREMYGYKAALFSTTLLIFNPNIIAHSGLNTNDIGITLFMFLTIFTFWKFMKTSDKKYLIITGILLGISMFSKMTALYLFPIMIVLLFLRIIYRKRTRDKLLDRFKKSSKHLLLIFIIGILTVNAAYLFKGTFTPLIKDTKSHPALDKVLPENMRNFTYTVLRTVPLPLPELYVDGIGGMFSKSVFGHKTFLLGEYSQTGWWYYYIIAFLMKNPVPLMILIFLTFVIWKRKKIEDEIFLLIPIIILFIAFSLGNIQIGIRHLLPIFPFLFVFLGQIGNKISFRNLNKDILSFSIIILSVWYIFSSLFAFPHYIAYFNEFVGDNDYKYLSDSNIDWGQDLKNLKIYMKENNIDIIKLSYFGTANVTSYGIKYQELGCNKEGGIIAISAMHLMDINKKDCYSWLNKFDPVGRAGRSILVYKI